MALHCPATLLITAPGDAAWARALAERLAGEHIAQVWSGPSPAATGAARLAAELLDVGAAVLDALDAEDPTGVDRDSRREALDHIADLHRGETVLVLARGGHGDADRPARLEIGDDGWQLLGRQNNR